jgi:hypothetical protein
MLNHSHKPVYFPAGAGACPNEASPAATIKRMDKAILKMIQRTGHRLVWGIIFKHTAFFEGSTSGI